MDVATNAGEMDILIEKQMSKQTDEWMNDIFSTRYDPWPERDFGTLIIRRQKAMILYRKLKQKKRKQKNKKTQFL